MNGGILNGYSINGPSNGGANATLEGSLSSVGAFAAALVVGAMLSGGIETQNFAAGRVSQSLLGGIFSPYTVGGGQKYTANLQQGITSEGFVASNLGLADGLVGGIQNSSGFGGELLCNTRLQLADNVGSACFVDALLAKGSGLHSGVGSNSWIASNIRGSTVLITSGVFSSSDAGGKLNNGQLLDGGFSSDAYLGSNYFINAYLQEGFASNHEIGKALQISAKLQSGMVHVGVVDSPSMRIDAELDWGLASSAVLTAQIQISPRSNDGVESTGTLAGVLRKDEKMLGGIESVSLADSVNLVATQRLPGGVLSDSEPGGYIDIDAVLVDGTGSTNVTNSLLVVGSVLSGSVDSTDSIGSLQVISALLKEGIEATGFMDASKTTSSLMTGPFGFSNGITGGELTGVSLLTSGVASSITVAGDIVQQFEDPLLNTWALSIRSATPILSLKTPLQDV